MIIDDAPSQRHRLNHSYDRIDHTQPIRPAAELQFIPIPLVSQPILGSNDIMYDNSTGYDNVTASADNRGDFRSGSSGLLQCNMYDNCQIPAGRPKRCPAGAS